MKENPVISIIMPCYNCSKTLKEAFDSIYKQNFLYPFEVILVDDGSKDSTVDLIKHLIEGKKECIFIKHPHNKGGGAARNTAIKASRGEIIFPLDSDDILADESLPLMVEYLKNENLDGTIFQYRRFFRSNPLKHREESNPQITREIILSDLFESIDKRILFNNFVYTRKAYDMIGGYPEDHGFDTPEFEFGFLGKGLSAKICPNSIYYHRQAAKNKSYFEREYEKGLFSIYVYLAIEPILDSFTDPIIDLLARFDAFSQNELRNENNLLGAIRRQYIKDGNMILSKKETARNEPFQAFVESATFIRKGDYENAISSIGKCVEKYNNISPILFFNTLRCLHGLKKIDQTQITNQALQTLQEYGILKTRKMRRLPSFVSYIYLICKKNLLRK